MRNLRRRHSLPVLLQKLNKLGHFLEHFRSAIFRAVDTEIHCISSRLPEVILAFAQKISAADAGMLISCAATILFRPSKRRVKWAFSGRRTSVCYLDLNRNGLARMATE